MSDVFDQPDDAATPLSVEEQRDLIPSHISNRRELNEAEQENIVRGQDWALGRRRRDLLTEKFTTNLHKQMLGEVWRWAGDFRHSERNLGIPFYEIPAALRQLLDDVKAWIEYKSYPPDEIAVRFQHRLVAIHPFPNGNGPQCPTDGRSAHHAAWRQAVLMGTRESQGCRQNAGTIPFPIEGRRQPRLRTAAGVRALIRVIPPSSHPPAPRTGDWAATSGDQQRKSIRLYS